VDYFGEEFYGGNGVCLPLHVQDPFADVSGHRLSERDDILCLNHLCGHVTTSVRMRRQSWRRNALVG
jgi:hypothetical protein